MYIYVYSSRQVGHVRGPERLLEAPPGPERNSHSLTHSLSPYHLEVALAARLIIGLCPFPRASPAVGCTQKIGTDVPQLVPIPERNSKGKITNNHSCYIRCSSNRLA